MNPVVSIGKKEFLEHTRRGGIIVIALLFAALAVGAALFTAAASEATGGLLRADMGRFIATVQPIVGLLVPIIVMLLAHGAIAGELEQGSLGLLLAQPITRAEVIMGKFAGLLAAAAAAIGAGFGVAGVIIQARGFALDWPTFLAFTGETILFAGAYLGLFLLYSALVKRRSAAIILSVVTWVVFGMVWDFITLALLVQVGGVVLDGGPRGGLTLPAWFALLQFMSPPSTYVWLIHAAHDVATSLLVTGVTYVGAHEGTPFQNPIVLGIVLAGWAAVTTVAAWFALDRRDV